MPRQQPQFVLSREWPECVWPYPTLPAGEHDVRHEIEHSPGPFASVRRVRALAVVDEELDSEHYGHFATKRRVIGRRVLHDVHEDGYSLVGRVSYNGRKVRAFTSDMLVWDEAGKLRRVAILYCCASGKVAE